MIDDLVARRLVLDVDVPRLQARAELAWRAATGTGR